MADRFPSPFEMPTPPGAEGWKDLYAYSTVFSEDRREYEDSTFWFMDGVHTPEVIPPWDATILEFAIIGLSQYNTRHYVIPPALGVDLRFLNGYMYLSPVGVADPEEIGSRVPEFAERAGYYFQNWDRLYAAWLPKVRALIDELESISFSPLPHREDMAVITEGRGTGSALDLISTYSKLVDLTMKLWHYHFEFLNLGYAAYLDFFGFCKQLFPSIPDQAIAKMVAGIQVDLFQPDDEIKKLAHLAVELGLADRFAGSSAASELFDELRDDPQGEKWLAAWEEASQPWFNFSAGSGFYHSDKVWLENPDIPLGFLRTYITKVQRGETLERPMEAVIAERERIVAEYSELIDSDEDQATFGAKLGLARTVFPYVENHNFYVEHWGHSVI
jgi:pyruvate,water dikinase